MKRIIFFVVLLSLWNDLLQGQLLFEENFSFQAGEALSDHGWTVHSGTTNPVLSVDSLVTWPGYPPSGIGMEAMVSGAGQDIHHCFAEQISGKIYVALLVRVTQATLTGDYFFHLGKNPLGSGFRGRLFVRRDASRKLSYGVSHSTTVTAMISYSTYIYPMNTSCLLVLRYDLNPGNGDDTVALFINPQVTWSEPANPLVSFDTPVDPGEIAAVALRQGGASSAPTVVIDGIRVARSWEALFEGIPQELFVTGTIAGGQSVCYNATSYLTTGGGLSIFHVKQGGEVRLITGGHLRMYPGTRFFPGAEVSASVTADSQYCTPTKIFMEDLSPEPAVEPLAIAPDPARLFPNPATDLVTLMLPHGTDAPGQEVLVDIYAMTGQRMERYRTTAGRFTFSVRDQPMGIYLVHVRRGEESEVHRLLVFREQTDTRDRYRMLK